MQATQDDIAELEKFQQDAFGSIGLKVGHPPIQEDWAYPECSSSFPNKQAMRMHAVAKHGDKHIAHAYMPATNFNVACGSTPHQATGNLTPQDHKQMSALPRFFAPAGMGYGTETAKNI